MLKELNYQIKKILHKLNQDPIITRGGEREERGNMIDDRLKFYLEEAAKEAAKFLKKLPNKNDPEERGWWEGRYLLAYTILKTWSPFSELKPPGDLVITNWGAKYPPKTYPAGKSAQEPSPEPNPSKKGKIDAKEISQRDHRHALHVGKTGSGSQR